VVAHVDLPTADHATAADPGDILDLPTAPKRPADLRPVSVAALPPAPAPAASHLLPPEEGARRFAAINLPVRPKFARKPVPAPEGVHVASAAIEPAASGPDPLARVRASITASRSHTKYEVRPGDMLSSIAQRELGSAALWPVLYAANRDQLTNPRWLQVGLALKIPRTSTGIAAAGARTYVVQAGDCL
jgi:nucleoid-associated protein YgaU